MADHTDRQDRARIPSRICFPPQQRATAKSSGAGRSASCAGALAPSTSRAYTAMAGTHRWGRPVRSRLPCVDEPPGSGRPLQRHVDAAAGPLPSPRWRSSQIYAMICLSFRIGECMLQCGMIERTLGTGPQSGFSNHSRHLGRCWKTLRRSLSRYSSVFQPGGLATLTRHGWCIPNSSNAAWVRKCRRRSQGSRLRPLTAKNGSRRHLSMLAASAAAG